jgi:hypothetical protein
MPTPRPIIVASVGAIVGTVTMWPKRPINERPTSKPTADEQADDRRDDRQPHRNERPKGKREDDHRCDKANDLAALRLGL